VKWEEKETEEEEKEEEQEEQEEEEERGGTGVVKGEDGGLDGKLLVRIDLSRRIVENDEEDIRPEKDK